MDQETKYGIGQFAKLTGLSIRTLHYYDQIGLLKAKKDIRSGHRYYDRNDIVIIQKIVTLKFLGYSLEQIIPLIEQPQFNTDLLETLHEQRRELEAQKEKIETALKSINRAVYILEESKEVESSLLINIIRTIHTEKEQREWMEQYVTPEMLSGLFDRTEEEMEELDKLFVQTVQEAKRLFGRPIDDPEVQALVEKNIQMSLQHVGGEDSLKELFELTKIEDDKIKELEALTPSPFTPEEDIWVQQAIEFYMKRNGLS
ncbi:MerR family transcriptional regulator [Paenibacillus sp. GCM10027627]|uniref:MerR family transcriptional regulator n=1 Tax=unclassified Paenibacillus TaxID=185978 RepID=UPI00362C1848